MTELVVTTPEALAQHIHAAVQRALDSYTPTLQPWLTLEEAAQYLRITPNWLRDLCREGKIPYGVVGKSRRFRVDDLDRCLTSTL